MMTTALVIVLRVSLLLGAAALVTVLLRRSSAATRHLVWTLAIVGSLFVPILSLMTPRLELPLLPATEPRLETIVPSPRGGPIAAPLSPTRHQLTAAPWSAATSGPPRAFPAFGLRPLVVSIWLLGLVLVLSRLAVGTARLRWIARRARPVNGGRWLRHAERLANVLGVTRRIMFLEGAAAVMPMTWGVLKPRVLLPQSASEWPAGRQRVVLLHELAHVKRRDCLTQLLAQVACAVYWFNPLAWLAARQLRAEREHACDDVVLAAGTRGSEYAAHLLDIARAMRGTALPTWAAVAMAHRSHLEGRLLAILDPEVPRQFPTRRRSLTLAAAITAVAIPIAIVTPVPQAAERTLRDPQTLAKPAPTPTPLPTRTPTGGSTISAAAAVAASPRRASAMADAIKDAVPDAIADLRAEGWLSPILRTTIQAIGLRVDAVGQAVGGVTGGVVGGVTGGVAGGVGQEVAEDGRQARRDPRVVAALMDALKDSDTEVREQAMNALATMGAPEALGAIRASLKDENPSVRQQAAFALGQYHDRASIDALAAALKDSSADVREQAVFALGQIRDPRAVDPIAAALKDANADVREQAAFALGQIGDRRGVESLVAALHDTSGDVREQAAFALGQLGDERAIEGLTAALKDASADVRRQAAFALGQIGR